MAFLQVPQEFASKTTDDIVASAGSPLPLIPEGKYQAMIVESEIKETSSGGHMLVLKAILTAGDYKGTEFTQRLNIINSNPVAVKIAYEELAKINKALGFKTIQPNSEALHGKPFLATVKTEKGTPYKDRMTGEMREGKDKSVIAGYDAIGPQLVGQQANAASLPWQK